MKQHYFLIGLLLSGLLFWGGCAEKSSDGDNRTGDNTPPIAFAGTDQTVRTGSQVTLDGSGSSDKDGDPLTYQWSIIQQPPAGTAVLSSATSVTPRLTANVDGIYVIHLIVNDGKIDSTADQLTITSHTGAINQPPIANAGDDEDYNHYNDGMFLFTPVSLDGSDSSDPDGDPLTYQWRIISCPLGSSENLSDPTAEKPSFTPDKPGIYKLSLVVNDGHVNSAPDVLTVIIPRIIKRYNGGAMNGFGEPFAIGNQDILYIGHSNSIRAIRLSDYSQIWKVGGNSSMKRIGGVAFSNGRIYAAEYVGSDIGKLRALDTTGDIIWSVDLGYHADGPVIDRNHTIHLVGDSSLWRIDHNGTKVRTATSYNTNYGPVVDDLGNIYFGNGSGEALVSYSSSTLRWSYVTAPKGAIYRQSIDDKGTTGDINDDIIYTGAKDGLHAVKASDGSLVWHFSASGAMKGQPIIGTDGTIYIGSMNDTFYAINADGTQKWSFDTSGDIQSAAALSDEGYLYFTASTGNGHWSMVYSLDQNGNLRWSESLYGTVNDGGSKISGNSCKIIISPNYRYFYILHDVCDGPETDSWSSFNRNNAGNGH